VLGGFVNRRVPVERARRPFVAHERSYNENAALGCAAALLPRPISRLFMGSRTSTEGRPPSRPPIPIQILVQSPAETDTDLQVICLFSSSPANTLHGSLVEANDRMRGLLDRVRSSSLFRGELGETLLLAPPRDSLGARKLLIIGLGDSETFSLSACNWWERSSIPKPAVLASRTRSSPQPSLMEA
jgi:hypothetical protein